MADAKPMYEVFNQRARGIGHLLQHAPVPGMSGFSAREALSVTQTAADPPTLIFGRRHSTRRHHSQLVVLEHVTPAGVEGVTFGPQTVLKSEDLGSITEVVDNRRNSGEQRVSYRDLFGKAAGEEQSSEKSAGTSVSVSVSASESVEGVAEFEESVTAEAHAEFSEAESSSSETTSEDESEHELVIAAGKRVRVTMDRKKADVVQTAKANGRFTHTVAVVETTGGHWHHVVRWDSWDEFKDCVNGDAPDNWPCAGYFREHPPYARGADRWALDDLNVPLEYDVKFEGRIVRSFTVEEF